MKFFLLTSLVVMGLSACSVSAPTETRSDLLDELTKTPDSGQDDPMFQSDTLEENGPVEYEFHPTESPEIK